MSNIEFGVLNLTLVLIGLRFIKVSIKDIIANNFPVSERKEKKLPKFLSRAASFGRKDKNKVKTNRLTDGRTYSSGRSDPRQSRKEAFLTGKEEVLPKETSV